MPSLTPLTLILASTPSLGIGFRGNIPWPLLKSELAFFARVTKRAPPPPTSTPQLPSATSLPPPASQDSTPPTSSPPPRTINAVLMGRKTWSSIPPTRRPLRDRINIIITRNPSPLLASLPPPSSPSHPIIVASSIGAGLQQIQAAALEGEYSLGRVFVIGGAEIYALALGMGECERVLWTRLEGEWECDVWAPEELGREEGGWVRRGDEVAERWCGEKGVGERKEERGVGWRVELWERERGDEAEGEGERVEVV